MLLEKIPSVIRDILAGIDVDNLLLLLAPAQGWALRTAGEARPGAGVGDTPAGEATGMPMVDTSSAGKGYTYAGKASSIPMVDKSGVGAR